MIIIKNSIKNTIEFKENFSLKNSNTFKIDCVAKCFCVIKNKEDIKNVFEFIVENNLKYFILGGGSNILFKNKFFDGVIIKNEINFLEERGDFIQVGGGYEWDSFVKYCCDNNIYGFENLSYIPGTVGAAPVQNIGAYGVEVSELIESVGVVDLDSMEERLLSNRECEFGYRESIFKKHNKKYFIISVNFKKVKDKRFNLEYKDIQNYLEKNKIDKESVDLINIRNMIIDIRNSKLPDWRAEGAPGTAGSFFKNPIISEVEYNKLVLKNEIYQNIPAFQSIVAGQKFYKLSAGYIMDKILNLKNSNTGNVGVYKNQALVIVNNGQVNGEEIFNYSEEIIKKCKDLLDIELEREVNIL